MLLLRTLGVFFVLIWVYFLGSIGCKLCIFSISFLVSQFLQSMALSNHPKGKFISPKTNKEFSVKDYPSFIRFIDRKKLTSHPYVSFRLLNLLVRLFTYMPNKITDCWNVAILHIFAPVCHSGHWWLWLINTRTRKCQILDSLHKKAPSDERKQLNKFTVSCLCILYFNR